MFCSFVCLFSRQSTLKHKTTMHMTERNLLTYLLNRPGTVSCERPLQLTVLKIDIGSNRIYSNILPGIFPSLMHIPYTAAFLPCRPRWRLLASSISTDQLIRCARGHNAVALLCVRRTSRHEHLADHMRGGEGERMCDYRELGWTSSNRIYSVSLQVARL